MTADTPPDTPFGPNEWLVDELYEQYLTDRESVDPAWWDFFADYKPGGYQKLRDDALRDTGTLTDAETGQPITVPPTSNGTSAAAPPSPAPPTPTTPAPAAVASPTTPAAPAEPAAPPVPIAQPPLTSPTVREGERILAPTPATMALPKIVTPPENATETDSAPLRGAAARVVTNME